MSLKSVISKISKFISGFYKNNHEQIDAFVLMILRTIAEDVINKRGGKNKVDVES